MSAQIIFITSTGRSGSKTLADLLDNINNITCKHEFKKLHTKSLGVKYLAKKITKSKLASELKKIYDQELKKCKNKYFIDCSDNIAKFIDVLKEIYPNAKFVHLYRDGRKVVSSIYNKLNIELYNKKFYNQTHNYFIGKIRSLPKKKNYWNNPPLKISLFKFKYLSQFKKICHYWNDVNCLVLKEFKTIKKEKKFSLKFENFISNKKNIKKFFKFLNIKQNKKEIDDIYLKLKRPHNVIVPKEYSLKPKQLKNFKEICGQTFINLKYNFKENYTTVY